MIKPLKILVLPFIKLLAILFLILYLIECSVKVCFAPIIWLFYPHEFSSEQYFVDYSLFVYLWDSKICELGEKIGIDCNNLEI